jgi:hypothetical protein
VSTSTAVEADGLGRLMDKTLAIAVAEARRRHGGLRPARPVVHQ